MIKRPIQVSRGSMCMQSWFIVSYCIIFKVVGFRLAWRSSTQSFALDQGMGEWLQESLIFLQYLMNLLHPWTLLLMLGGYPKRLGKSVRDVFLELTNSTAALQRADGLGEVCACFALEAGVHECKGGKRVPWLVGPPSSCPHQLSLQASGCKDSSIGLDEHHKLQMGVSKNRGFYPQNGWWK